MKISVLILLLCSLACHSVWAADGRPRALTLVVVLHDKRQFQDGPLVRVKEAETGKVAQITLRKAAKIPEAWANFFLITFSPGETESKTIEFYTLNNTKYLTYFRSDKKVQRVDLFRNEKQMNEFIAKEEAKGAAKAAARLHTSKSVKISAPGSEAPVATPKKKAKAAEALVEEAQKINLLRDQARMTLEEQQAKARLAQIERQSLLSMAEKKAKQKKAKELIALADAAYTKEDYTTAEKYYAESLQIDPSNDSTYYKYGVSLYKTENYIKSLANLSLADVSAEEDLEKQYYIGLNYLKLENYDKALEQFDEVKEENDPTLSPVAAFFAGNIQYQRNQYTDARKNMEYTIDNSNDPGLANSAEQMLEQIDKAESFYGKQKEKFRATLFAGLTYDTNVLNIAENNISTDVKAVRANGGAILSGIWHRDMKSDFGTDFSISDYYSLDSSLQGNATLQSTDPLDMSLQLPYHREFTVAKRTVSWEFIPLYRSIFMAPTGGSREQVISSAGLNTTASWAISQDWFISNRVDLSLDKSYLNSAADDDLSGSKYGVTIAPTKILDLNAQKTLGADLSYFVNSADGKNSKYNKMGIGLTYGFPSLWTSQGSLRVSYDSQNYPDASVSRTDKVTSLLFASSKDIKANLNFMASLMYNSSSSEVSAYNYNKFVVAGLFTYRMSYLDK